MNRLSVEMVQKAALLVLVVLTVTAAGFFSFFIAWSVLAGGMIVLVNLWFSREGIVQMADTVASAAATMSTDAQQVFAGSKRRGYLLRFWLRIVVTGIALFVLIRWQLVDIFGLLVGLSTIFITAMGLSFATVVYYLIQRNQGRR